MKEGGNTPAPHGRVSPLNPGAPSADMLRISARPQPAIVPSPPEHLASGEGGLGRARKCSFLSWVRSLANFAE